MDDLIKGGSVKNIAAKFNINQKTVYAHRKKAMNRLGLSFSNARGLLLYRCMHFSGQYH